MGKFLSLPDVLQPYAAKPIWMLWKRDYKPKKNKWTKLPYQTNNPKAKAKCNDPSTWALFDDALKAFNAGQGDGIGFAILGADDIGAFDLDDCRNAQSGDLEPAAQRLIGLANWAEDPSPAERAGRQWHGGRDLSPLRTLYHRDRQCTAWHAEPDGERRRAARRCC